MRKITPYLKFGGKAEEAVTFYVSIFKNSKIIDILRYGEAVPKLKEKIAAELFQLDGQEFIASDDFHKVKFSEAISLLVGCSDQEEVDDLWEKLSEGGEKGESGWLKDKYNISWQIVPIPLGEMLIETLKDKKFQKTKRILEAMTQMTKIDIKTLKNTVKQP